VGKIAKIAGWTGVLLAYVWVAGVRNVAQVKRQKSLRKALDKQG
jgi:hypothetical protein